MLEPWGVFKVPAIALLAFVLAACGTTGGGERRYSAAGITDVQMSGCLPQAEGACIPFELSWLDGKAKANVKVTAYTPAGKKLFEYEASDVTQPEDVMATLALVKAQIAQAQLSLGGDAVDALASAITGALLGGTVRAVLKDRLETGG